jgi:hypothetical protein
MLARGASLPSPDQPLANSGQRLTNSSYCFWWTFWGKGEYGAEGGLGRKGACGGREYGAEGSMGLGWPLPAGLGCELAPGQSRRRRCLLSGTAGAARVTGSRRRLGCHSEVDSGSRSIVLETKTECAHEPGFNLQGPPGSRCQVPASERPRCGCFCLGNLPRTRARPGAQASKSQNSRGAPLGGPLSQVCVQPVTRRRLSRCR